MAILLLCPVRGAKNLVDIGRRTITSIRGVVVILVEVATVEYRDVLVAPAGKPQRGAQAEHTAADDDHTGVRIGHFVGRGDDRRKSYSTRTAYTGKDGTCSRVPVDFFWSF